MTYELSQQGYEEIREFAVKFFGDAEVVQCVWAQAFGNTTCGFGGVGGQAITAAVVTVFTCNGKSLVFVGPRLAYAVESKTQEQVVRLAMDIMAGNVIEASRYAGEYGPKIPMD